MKTLHVYKENGEFVIERVNEFNHATKRLFVTEEGLKEGLDCYRPVIAGYKVAVDVELIALVRDRLD
ncbi:hypothetical protein D1B31_22065 [Neobacillus notoginsengisoli]|uniref:Uncharacterized protein n=1 Tax=Neobacillus notoginsengisoli TaxID=1578198 RepID=A0A417YFL8_9BACI|nr:hypothetical protein [Neobacillus notoginsengisoli]RHW31495.1 hypothetical protein D1B31_22065 [Neobacillus notoginsengisoli]